MADLLSQIVARADAMGTQGKSMADLHPEFSDREHLATLRSDGVTTLGTYSYLSGLGDHASHVWVRKAVNVVMNSFAPLPLSVLRNEKQVEGGHAALDLLQHVNDEMSPVDLWQQWAVDMLLGGEEGWELTKTGSRYSEIFPRQPHTISIVPDKPNIRYFGVAAYTIDDGLGDPYHLKPDEAVLFKFYNPRNPWRGLAPISAVRSAILIDTFAQAWSKLFFQKGARPDFAVITPEGTTKSEREDMELKLASKFGGSDNWFRPVVLEKGVTDIKPLDFKPRDLEWIAQRELARDEIGAIFGVPDEIMGYGRDTYENFETAHWVLWALTIMALCGLRDTHLTKFFRRVGLLKPNERLVTDVSQVEALKKSLKDKVAAVVSLCGVGAPFNAASAHVGFGLTIPGGDVGYMPANLIPVGSTPPTPAPPPAPKQLQPPQTKGIAYDSREHRTKWDAFVKRTDPQEKTLGRAVAGMLERQQTEVLARLRKTGKTVTKDSPQDVADNPFDRDAWEKEFRDTVKPILTAIVSEAGTAALADIGIGIAFDLLEPAVVEFLNERNQRFAQNVNETTWTQLKASLNAGLAEGESITDLAARVENVMGARIRSSGETIARTEVIGASNGGTLQAWDQSEVVVGKDWLSALDTRTRNHAAGDEFDHVDAHGESVGLHEPFVRTGEPLQFPGDAGSAGNVINCRCTMTARLNEAKVAQARRRKAAGANGHGKMVRA